MSIIKKYFSFDNEPISGTTYLLRLFAGTFLIIFLIGFWILAATGYKRAGAFKWSNELRIICSIMIPIHAVINIISNQIGEVSQTFNLMIIIVGVLHLILLCKNGNKKTST